MPLNLPADKETATGIGVLIAATLTAILALLKRKPAISRTGGGQQISEEGKEKYDEVKGLLNEKLDISDHTIICERNILRITLKFKEDLSTQFKEFEGQINAQIGKLESRFDDQTKVIIESISQHFPGR